MFLKSLSLSFSNTFLDCARCTVYQVLSFFQTKTTSFLNGLYNLKLRSACALQYYIECCFLCLSSSAGSRASSNSYSCSSRFNTIFVFQNLSKFVYFFY